MNFGAFEQVLVGTLLVWGAFFISVIRHKRPAKVAKASRVYTL
jgi:hypothetical protein